jgi:hypothetical protein
MGRRNLLEGKPVLRGLRAFGGAKTRRSKFGGIGKDSCYYHLKEGEFRFND